MFERGKREMEAGQPTDRPEQAGQSAAPAQSGSRRAASSGQVAVIGRSIHINGDVKGDEDLLIEGDVSGTIELKNNSVTIGSEGKVKANIYARVVVVEGTTEGDLYASEKITIRASANMSGNLVAPRIALEDGARFKGSLDMDPKSVEKVLGAGTQNKPSARPETTASTASASRPNVESKAAVTQAAS